MASSKWNVAGLPARMRFLNACQSGVSIAWGLERNQQIAALVHDRQQCRVAHHLVRRIILRRACVADGKPEVSSNRSQPVTALRQTNDLELLFFGQFTEGIWFADCRKF